MHKRVGPNSTHGEAVGRPSRTEEDLHLKLERLASRASLDLSGLHAALVALQRIGTTLVEGIDASEDGMAIERLAGDSKEACERLAGFIDDTLRPLINEASHG